MVVQDALEIGTVEHLGTITCNSTRQLSSHTITHWVSTTHCVFLTKTVVVKSDSTIIFTRCRKREIVSAAQSWASCQLVARWYMHWQTVQALAREEIRRRPRFGDKQTNESTSDRRSSRPSSSFTCPVFGKALDTAADCLVPSCLHQSGSPMG